jgi:hypothetical protein
LATTRVTAFPNGSAQTSYSARLRLLAGPEVAISFRSR